MFRQHPCLAKIVDVEYSRWDPTVDFGGGHGDTSQSYGLPQGNPGSKMARYTYTATGHSAGEPTGALWATSRWVQMSWMLNYAVGRYGSECAAWDYRWRNGSY